MMKDIHFEWDEDKNNINFHKHGIDFNEAQSCFYDPNARVIFDPDHSEKEERFILLGLSNKLKLILVCHCYRKNDEVIRIISARKANKSEYNQYGGFKDER